MAEAFLFRENFTLLYGLNNEKGKIFMTIYLIIYSIIGLAITARLLVEASYDARSMSIKLIEKPRDIMGLAMAILVSVISWPVTVLGWTMA